MGPSIARRTDPIVTQRRDEGHGLPMAERCRCAFRGIVSSDLGDREHLLAVPDASADNSPGLRVSHSTNEEA